MNHEDLRHRHDRADDQGEAFAFNDAEQYSLINALQVAAEKFTQNAALIRGEAASMASPTAANMERLAEQFDKQATEALRLAARIEAGE